LANGILGFTALSKVRSWAFLRSTLVDHVFDRYFFLALFVSTSPILVLVFGLTGNHGNSLVTGSFMAASTAALFLFGNRRSFTIEVCDIIFGIYVCCVATSFWINGSQDLKEVQLLVLSLAAYPACRLFAGDGVKPTFIIVTGIIVTAGSIVTATELVHQWDDIYGRPTILGLYAAAVNFAISLGFVMIALACVKLSPRQVAVASLLIFPQAAIFAAAMVRFAFVAIIMSVAVAALTLPPKQRWPVVVILIVFVSAIMTGQLVRYKSAVLNAGYAVNAIKTITGSSSAPSEVAPITQLPLNGEAKIPVVGPKPPSCSTGIDERDTIAIRLALLADAWYLIRSSGLFGIGLDNFKKVSCVPEREVHNSFLQATIEFGWIAGAALLTLVSLASWYLIPLTRSDPESRFALCCLVFVSIMDMASGRSSRDALLFLFLGYAVGLHRRASVQL
jgi:hypothetical protein